LFIQQSVIEKYITYGKIISLFSTYLTSTIQQAMKKQRQFTSGKGVRPRRAARRQNGEIVYTGSVAVPVSVSTTASAITLDSFVSAGSQFLQGLGDSFQEYRFDKLKLRFSPFASGASTDLVTVGFQNEISDGVPTTNGAILVYPANAVMTNSNTTNQWLNVSKRNLRGKNLEQLWRTQLPNQSTTVPSGGGTVTAPTSNVWESVQGVFWFLASTTISCFATLMYTVKLASPILQSLSPQPRGGVSSEDGTLKCQGVTHYEGPKKKLGLTTRGRPRTEAILGFHYQSLCGHLCDPTGKVISTSRFAETTRERFYELTCY
jgi:hypothetical protein